MAHKPIVPAFQGSSPAKLGKRGWPLPSLAESTPLRTVAGDAQPVPGECSKTLGTLFPTTRGMALANDSLPSRHVSRKRPFREKRLHRKWLPWFSTGASRVRRGRLLRREGQPHHDEAQPMRSTRHHSEAAIKAISASPLGLRSVVRGAQHWRGEIVPQEGPKGCGQGGGSHC